MNDQRPTTASTGSASGSTTPQKICAGVAPSTRADSSSSFGMVSKKPFISHVFTPIAPPRYTRMSARYVFSPIAGKIVADVEDDQVDRDDRQELREHLDQEQREHAHRAGP